MDDAPRQFSEAERRQLQTLASASTVPACFILTAMNSPEVTTVTTVVIMGGWTRAVKLPTVC